jgi:Zn-dependent peptidase ImmA (M78 family)/transcriptional regulator with XRE-family HTH domain
MPATSEAFITPAVLRWARDRARISLSVLAEKLHKKPESLAQWENGESRPTFRQAQNLANLLQIPFGYLFLSSPPAEPIELPDFRTIKNMEFASPTAEFINLLYDVLAKHSWYRATQESLGAEELRFVGRFTVDADANEIAIDIAKHLEITGALRASVNSWESFIGRLAERAERLGIMVMRSGLVAGNTRRRVSEKEFRGFAIADKLAPLVYVNSSDAKAAQNFTLGHELAHIWTGQTGISSETPADFGGLNVEIKCNAVAAELLVPRDEFSRKWNPSRTLDFNLSECVRYFRVSSLVILRRTIELALVPEEVAWARYRQEEAVHYKKQEDGGGDFWRNLFSRNGRLFTSAVVGAVQSDRTLYSEAASLLNVRVPTVPKVATELAKSPNT